MDPQTSPARFVSPDFDRPPLLEVALAVEFSPIADFGAVAMAGLARSWSSRYPEIQEHHPLPPGPALGAPAGPGVVVNVGAPQLRLWCVAASGERVVQVQRDRLIVNWRAAFDGGPYPRYRESLRPEFEKDLGELVEFVSSVTHRPPTMTTTEATYVNALDPSEPDVALRSLPAVTHHLGAPTVSRLDQTWSRHAQGRLVGTVNASVVVGDGDPLLTISARTAVGTGRALDSVLESLDMAHEDVVTTFLELTTSSAQTSWGRTS